MNVKLSHDVSFSAVVVDGFQIFPNTYKLKIDMLTVTENAVHQNVAIQRILFFIKEILNGSVFIHAKNPNVKKISNLAKESRVILFPEEPFDQIIALILFHKLHAIVEGKFELDNIKIGSNVSPDLMYTVEDFENFEYDESKIESPWWQRPDPSTTDELKKIKKCNSWADLNLDWEENNSDLQFVLELENNEVQPSIVVLDGGEQ